MKQIKDLTNKVFGRWKVLKYDSNYYDKSNHKRHNWLCQCQCKYKTIRKIEHTRLLSGLTNSCRKCINIKYNNYDLSGEYGIGYLDNKYFFYFDLEDYDLIKDYCWYKHKDGYLRAKIENTNIKYILQHRLILNCVDSIYEVDHKNRLPYDNRKSNLILVTHNENMKNYGKSISNTSGIIGVHYSIRENSWKSYIQFNDKRYHLGTFSNKQKAIITRLKKEKELYKTINKKPPQQHLFEQYGIK